MSYNTALHLVMSRSNIILPNEQLSYLKRARPAAHLRSYVDHYYEVRLTGGAEEVIWHTSLPALHTSICIRIDGPGWGFVGKSGREKVLSASGVIGQSLEIRRSKHPGGMHNFFAILKPGVLPMLLKSDPASLENLTIDPEILFKTDLVEEQLNECSTFEARVTWFDAFLMSYIRESGSNFKYNVVQQGLELFQRPVKTETQHLNTLCRELAVSPPTLYRYFREITGYSPKFCQKLIRLRKGLELYNAEGYNFAHWEYGFTDFSHFVKLTRQITGMAPGEI